MATINANTASLTITTIQTDLYAQTIVFDDPVAYWKLDEIPAASMDDTFTGTTINQDLWDDTYGSGSGGSGSVTQASGVLSLSADNDNATTYVRGALARHYMVGDFDVQFDFSNLSYTGTGSRYFVMLCGMEANGYQEAYCAAAKTSGNTDVYAAAAGDGTESQLSRSGSSGKLRIARVGSTITCYYWNGSSWTTIDTATGRDTAPAFVLVRAQGNSDGDSVVSGDIDNFTVTADSIVKRLAVDTAGVYGMGNYGPATQGSSPAIHDGSAYTFNGTDQYAYKASSGFQLSDTEGSIEAWFKTTDTGEGVIWATSDEASNTWYAYLAINNGEVKWRIQNNAANYVYETSGQSLNDGKLHHVVVAIGPSNTRRIYVDGVNTGATGNGFWFNNPASNLLNTDNVTIGALKYSTGEVSHFDGTIDEVAYYDAELSAAQVTSHYEAGKSTVPDALTITTYSVDFIPDAYGQVVYDKTPVAWWRLDDGDPYLDYAVFGSHFDGADDATTFTDDIGSATFTRHGGTTLQDTQKKFGATSYYNGVADSGSALEINGSTSNTDYQLTGDFTLEMWVFVTANTEFNFTGLFTKVDTSSRSDGAISSYEFGLTYSAPNFFPMVNNLNNAGGTNYGLGAGATGFPINEWHHIVFERYGGRLTTYLDGAVNNFRTGLDNFVGTLGARRVLIGASTQNTTGERHSLHGYIDDLILYNGVAKYKGQAFDAPTADFVDAQPTTIADFYGNNNGVASGLPALLQSSLIADANNSISFNGTTQYIRRAASDWQGSDSLGSIAAWFSTTYTGGDQTIFSSSDEATNNSYLALLLRNDRIRIQKYDGAITTFLGDYIVDVHDGNPHHVVLTSSGTAYKLYLDGEEVTITATQGTNNGDWLADLSGRDNVTIGVMERSTKINYFNGTIDDVAYFDTELDAGIINHMYLVGAEASTPALTVTPQSPVTIEQKTHYEKVIEDSNPISWWKLDEYTWDGIDTFDEGSVPDPDVWNKYNAGTVTSDTFTVSNGALHLGVVAGGTNGIIGAQSRFSVSGDFDVILDVDNFSHDAGTSAIYFHIQTTFTGGAYYNMGVVQATNVATQNFRKDVNGSATEYSKTDDTPFRVRMARVGTTLTFYSDDNVGSWTSRGSHTVGTENANINLLAYAFGNTTEVSTDVLGATFTADSFVQRDHKDYGSEARDLIVVTETTRVSGLAEPKLSNHAYDFNGTDQYLSWSVANYRSSDNIGTVEAWVEPDSTTEGAVFSVCTSDAGERLVVFASSNLIRVYTYDATTGDDHVYGIHGVGAGNRYHMAVTTTGSAWKLYVNGVELTPVVGSGQNGGYWISDLVSNDTDRVYIGVWRGNNTFFGNFDGTIDEVIYYNRQLSESEIHEHYQAGANPYRTVRGQIEYDRAVNHWPMGKSGIPGASAFISLYLRGRADLTDYSDNSTTFNGTHSYASGGKFIDPNRGDNQAIDFSGAGHIYTSTTYGADSIWDMQGDFTIQAWVKLDTYQDWRTICAWFDNGGEGWRLLVGATGVLHFSTDAGLTNGFFSAAGAVPTGEWVHVAATNKDGINKGWVNGKLVATQKVWSFTPPSTAREFRIGSTDGNNWKWDGQMQEILIHNGIALWDRNFEPPHGTNYTYDDFGTAPLDVGVGNGADIVDSLNADGVNDYRDIPHLASRATDFNGTNEYLFSNVPDFRSSDTEGSIEAWFNARDDVADNRVIFNVSDKDHVSGYNRFVLYLSSAASYTIRLYTVDNAGTAHSVSTTASGWADSKTHHVVLTSSGTAWKIYVDGVNQALTVNTGSNNGNWIGDLGTTDVVHIGTQETQSIQSDWFDGTIDDVAIYDYELSADQVAEHYELGVSQNTDALIVTTHKANFSDSEYAGVVITDGPLAYWRLNETSGTTAFDEIGSNDLSHQNTPTLDANALIGDGSAYSFDDASNEHLQHTSNSALNITTGGITIEVWIQPTKNSNFQFVVCNDANNGGSNGNYSLYISDSGAVVFSFWRGTLGNEYFWGPSNSFIWDAPNHIVFTHTWGSTADTATYVNGKLISGSTSWSGQDGTGTPVSPGNFPFTIGHTGNDAAYPFNGIIDEVAIYEKVLTATQVEQHFEAGRQDQFITPNTVPLTITEYNYLDIDTYINASTDALVITEYSVSGLNDDTTVSATTDALVITEQQAGIDHAAIVVNATSQALALTEQLAGIQHDAISVDTNVDALILTEYPMSIGFDYSPTTIVDTLILTGQKAKVANSYADSVIQDGPISFLRFESSSGVVYSDYSGNGNTGIANVALTRVPSLVFNDREARATEIAATQQIVGTTGLIDQFPFTVEYFFEYTSTGTNCQHWCTTDKASSYAGVAMGTNAADQVYVRFGNATFQATDDRRDYVTGAILTDGAIHHVAAVFTGHAAGTIYINGVPNALTYLGGSGSYTDFDGGTKPFVIGSSTQLYENAAGDTFDEFAIYDKALTAGEIEAHYNAAEAPPGFLYTFLETLTHTTYQSEIVHSAISVDTNPDPLLITERQASIDFSAVFVNATRDPLIITERQASIVFEPYTYYTAPDTLQIYEFTAGINADWPLVFAKTVPLALTEYNAGIFLPIVGINTVPDVLLQSPQRADIQWDAIYVQQLAPTAFTLTEYAATISTGINATSVALTTTTYVADPDLDPNLLPINASTDTLAITELAAFIEKDTTVEASSDSLVFTSGGDVLLGWDIALETTTAALTLTPLGLDFPINIDGTTVALTITEYQSTPTLPVTINAAPDQVQVNAQQASIQNLTEIDTNVDALVITEQLSGIYFSPAINVDTNIDALVFTGQTIDIGFARTISASLFPVLLTERPVSFALNAGIADPLAITTHVAEPDMTIFVDQAAATTMTVAEQQADVALDVTIEATSQDLRFGLWSVIITLPILTIETNIDPLVIGQWSTTIIVQNTVFDCAVDTLTLTGQPAEIQLFKQIDAGTDYLNIFEKEAQVAIPVFGIDATQVSLSLTEQQSSITNEVTTLIRAENQPVFYITERQADVLMPIDIVNATKDQVVAASYPASIDMPIINIDAGVDTIVISGETQSFSYFSTLTIDPGSFVQQNYNIGFEWSDDPATILTIEETSFITIYNKIVFRIDIPSGPVGYKIVMSGPTEYELIK